MAIVTFPLIVLHCVPVVASWAPQDYPDAKCMNFADFVTGTASVSVMTDALVLMLPTWIVYNLKIQRKQKLALIGILSFGIVYVRSLLLLTSLFLFLFFSVEDQS
jgi:Fungal rhodopsin domain